jgi:DNA-binding NarL/FixJ family response regulator
MTKVLVAAASAVVRAGLQAILSSQPGLEVVGVSPLGEALVHATDEAQPDVVLLEVEQAEASSTSSPSLPSFEDASAPPAFVLLEGVGDAGIAVDAVRRGALAVLPRDASPDEIVAAVNAAAAGLVVLPRPTALSLFPVGIATVRTPTSTAEPLTPREIEVLAMLAEGAGNKLIARRLGISEHTVKFHVGSILAKLDASSRTEAVTLGLRQGLIMV